MAGPQQVTITNIGPDPFTLVDATVGGLTPTAFTAGSAAGLLAAGATRMVDVSFSPQNPGDYSATLGFAASDNTIPPATVSLTGKGEAARVELAPATLDFGKVPVGTTSAPRTVTVSNTSADTVQLASIASDAAAFAVAGNATASIPAGARSTFTVTFAPAMEGMATANIALTLAGAASPEVVLAATGTGVAPAPPDMAMGGAPPKGGCSVAGQGSAPTLGMALALLVLALGLRRRRPPTETQ
jgi:MYXO-CTERM domain-containing protein